MAQVDFGFVRDCQPKLILLFFAMYLFVRALTTPGERNNLFYFSNFDLSGVANPRRADLGKKLLSLVCPGLANPDE